MMSPETFVNNLEDKSYEELLIEREKLLSEIKEFENSPHQTPIFDIQPSLDTRYKCNLLYLAKLCELIEKKYKG